MKLQFSPEILIKLPLAGLVSIMFEETAAVRTTHQKKKKSVDASSDMVSNFIILIICLLGCRPSREDCFRGLRLKGCLFYSANWDWSFDCLSWYFIFLS